MKRILLLLILITSIAVNAQRPSNAKEKDYLVFKLENRTLGAKDAKYNELTTQNTQFLSKKEYRQLPYVKKKFTHNGVFDEKEWDQFYALLQEEWIRFCYKSYEDCAKIEIWHLNPDGSYPRSMPINIKIVECNGCTFWKIIR